MRMSLSGKRRKDAVVKPLQSIGNQFAGKKAVIVGGTGGLGRAIAKSLATKGTDVTVVGRTFKDQGVANLSFIQADLTSLKRAKDVADQLSDELVESLDYLILTTGIFAGRTRIETDEGIEIDMAVSYLSRYVILQSVAARLGKSLINSRQKTRVFVMGFPGMDVAGDVDDFNCEKDYSFSVAHYNTIIGNESLVSMYAKCQSQFNCYGLNPGLIKSEIRTELTGKDSLVTSVIERLIGVFNQDAETYAEKIATLIASPDLEKMSGTYFNKNVQLIVGSGYLDNSAFVEKVMTKSQELVERALA